MRDRRIHKKAKELYAEAKNTLLVLEGIMPHYDPLGDRSHEGWHCINNLKRIIDDIENGKDDEEKIPI